MHVRHVPVQIAFLLGAVIAHRAGEDLDVNVMPGRHVLCQIAFVLGAVIAHRAGEDLDVNIMLVGHVLFQSAFPLGAEIAHRAGEDLDVNVIAHRAILPTYAVVLLRRLCRWPHTVTDVGLYHRRWSWRGWQRPRCRIQKWWRRQAHC